MIFWSEYRNVILYLNFLDEVWKQKDTITQAARNIIENILKNVYKHIENHLFSVLREQNGQFEDQVNWKGYGYSQEDSPTLSLIKHYSRSNCLLHLAFVGTLYILRGTSTQPEKTTS